MLLRNKPHTRKISVRSKQKGFLLLEVLVALTILSVGIIAVIKSYSVSLRAQKHARFHTSALLLASKIHEEIEAATIDDVNGEELIGTGSFKWSIDIEPTDIKELESVKVKVSWQERLKEHEVSFFNLYPESFVDEVFKK